MIILAAAVLVLIAGADPAAAQCAMCKAVIENSVDAAEAASGLNLAAIVLLVPPVTLFSGIFYAIYRFRDVQGRPHRFNFIQPKDFVIPSGTESAGDEFDEEGDPESDGGIPR
jgi:hypothetical protein